MNRQQKRQFVLQAKKKGFSASEAQQLLNHKPNQERLWEGAKVKLDTLWMRLSPDWYNNKYRKDYKDWVLAHKDMEFTVVFDQKRKEKHSNFDIMVCLEEDTTEPKWYFFAGDLILLSGSTPKPKIEDNKNIEKSVQILTEETTKASIQKAVQEALERENSKLNN